MGDIDMSVQDWEREPDDSDYLNQLGAEVIMAISDLAGAGPEAIAEFIDFDSIPELANILVPLRNKVIAA